MSNRGATLVFVRDQISAKTLPVRLSEKIQSVDALLEVALVRSGQLSGKFESHTPTCKLLRTKQKQLTSLQELREHETLTLRCGGILGGSNKLLPEDRATRNSKNQDSLDAYEAEFESITHMHGKDQEDESKLEM